MCIRWVFCCWVTNWGDFWSTFVDSILQERGKLMSNSVVDWRGVGFWVKGGTFLELLGYFYDDWLSWRLTWATICTQLRKSQNVNKFLNNVWKKEHTHVLHQRTPFCDCQPKEYRQLLSHCLLHYEDIIINFPTRISHHRNNISPLNVKHIAVLPLPRLSLSFPYQSPETSHIPHNRTCAHRWKIPNHSNPISNIESRWFIFSADFEDFWLGGFLWILIGGWGLEVGR